MIVLINSIIKDAVAKIPDSSYLRATDRDANVSVSKIELAGKTFCVFDNLPTFDNEVAGGVIAKVPISIQLLKLARRDDKTINGDLIRDGLIINAQTLYNDITKDPRHSLIEFADSYEIELEDQVKIYDTILTGVRLSFIMNINVTNLC